MALHADEIAVTVETVQALLARERPDLARLEIRYLADSGTDSHLFRVGPDHLVRLPRTPACSRQIRRDAELLPHLAGLPMEVPRQLHRGGPSSVFGHDWAIYSWIHGTDGFSQRPAQVLAALDMAQLITAMHRLPPDILPRSYRDNGRSRTLADRTDATLKALAEVADEVPEDAARALWERALAVPPHDLPVFAHADMHPGNLVIRDGRIVGVIDFGMALAGDPALDLCPAWTVFETPAARARLRDELGVDDDTWLRGMGWTLSIALVALPYYRGTDSPLADMARGAIGRLLEA